MVNHVIRGKSRDAWHASSACVLYLASRLPMLMLPCSQPATLAAATPAERAGERGGASRASERAGGYRVTKMSAVCWEDLFTCASAKMLFAGRRCFGRIYSRALARRCSSRVLLVSINSFTLIKGVVFCPST